MNLLNMFLNLKSKHFIQHAIAQIKKKNKNQQGELTSESIH